MGVVKISISVLVVYVVGVVILKILGIVNEEQAMTYGINGAGIIAAVGIGGYMLYLINRKGK